MNAVNETRPGALSRINSFGLDRWKLTAGAAGFIALTAGIFWYQFHSIRARDQAPNWDGLRWGYLTLILICLPIETLAAAARMWLLCRVLHPGVRLWTCVKAELSNATISLMTPSQTGGGPAQIYMLSRAGVGVGTSLTISLISFMGTTAVLVLMGLYSVLVSGVGDDAPFFLTVFWTILTIILAIIAGAFCPSLSRAVLGILSQTVWRLRGGRGVLHEWRPPNSDPSAPPAERMGALACKLAGLVYTYQDDARKFLKNGKAAFAWTCLLSAAFLFSRALMPYLCLRFLGVEGSTLREVVEAQTALIFLVFFAPTPGGAGLTEGASTALMAGIVPAGFVPYYNLLWRFSTAYFAALAGLVCLLHAVARDLGKTVWRLRKGESKKMATDATANPSQERMEVVP
jgi:glycosyltransferase 2 family protein